MVCINWSSLDAPRGRKIPAANRARQCHFGGRYASDLDCGLVVLPFRHTSEMVEKAA